MSFFQTILNSYKPYHIEKNQFDVLSTSLIFSAYNSCYPIVDNTKNTTTVYRKKVATEAMLFLLAYGISFVAQKKGYDEFKYRGYVYLISDVFSKSVIAEIRNYNVNKSFIEERIFNYCTLLNDDTNDSNMIYALILLNEKPLTKVIHSPDDFPQVTIDSPLAKDLGEILTLSSHTIKALELMKQAMKKSFGII